MQKVILHVRYEMNVRWRLMGNRSRRSSKSRRTLCDGLSRKPLDKTVAALIARITPNNRRAEVSFGTPVGHEVWPPFDNSGVRSAFPTSDKPK